MVKASREVTVRPKLYWELAPWFHLLTHPKSYAGEARWVRRQLLPQKMKARPLMLELGSGGGNNALHLKKHFALTLTDVSPRMLALSRKINPACEHIAGDMRALRLKRHFDFVFAHDAISYMTSERDLARAIKTAFVHCKPGGVALFQPDDMRETFRTQQARRGRTTSGRALRRAEITDALVNDTSESTTSDFARELFSIRGNARVFLRCDRCKRSRETLSHARASMRCRT